MRVLGSRNGLTADNSIQPREQSVSKFDPPREGASLSAFLMDGSVARLNAEEAV